MNLKPIRNAYELEQAFVRLETLWGAPQDTPEGDELDILVMLIERFESEHEPIPPSEPIEAIHFRMEQMGLIQRDLEPYIGTSGRVSEVLGRKRRLTLPMIRRLHQGLRIPYESLLGE